MVNGVATTVRKTDGTSVTYHETEVVNFDENKIVLDSGGWKTVTTKRRMNQISSQYNLGYSVVQKKNKWFVNYKGKTIPFKDKMILKVRGVPIITSRGVRVGRKLQM